MTTIKRIQVSTGIISQSANIPVNEAGPLVFNTVPGQIYALSFLYAGSGGAIEIWWGDSESAGGITQHFVDDSSGTLTVTESDGFTLIVPGDKLILVITGAANDVITFRATPIGY